MEWSATFDEPECAIQARPWDASYDTVCGERRTTYQASLTMPDLSSFFERTSPFTPMRVVLFVLFSFCIDDHGSFVI
jgi:hypothetical protein